MRKSVRLLAPVAAIALMPMGAMTMPTASSAPCVDGQFWSPHHSACEPLPCPSGASFDANADVCECHFGSRYNQLRNTCQPVDIYEPPSIFGR
jgi:hypothetical protein